MQGLTDFVRGGCREDSLVQIAGELIEFASPQTELFEDDPQIKDFVKTAVGGYLQRLGIPYKIDGFGNLLAAVGREDGPSIALISYAMTAAAGNMREPFKAILTDGEPYGLTGPCLRGRGITEQKGGMAAMLEALRVCKEHEQELQGRVWFVCSTAGETGRHDALAYLVEQEGFKADLAIIALGTNQHICLGNKGRVDVVIEVEGKACHSSLPHLGINAIEGARQVLNALHNTISEPEHPHFGRATFAPIHIESFPHATHTIQARCELHFDRRLLPGQTPEGALQEIEQALTGIEGFGIKVIKGPFMYPVELSEQAKVAALLGSAIAATSGEQARTLYSHSALDAGYLHLKGIETVMYGPGDCIKYAHTDEELVPVKDLLSSAHVLTYAVFDYLS